MKLVIEDVSLRFGGIAVLERASMRVAAGAVMGLVGPNGAGKTSLFNCISGHYRPASGSIRIDGRDTLRLAPWRLAARGLARTFQHPVLQNSSSAIENVMLGANHRMSHNPLSWAVSMPSVRRSERTLRRQALDLLDGFGFADLADRFPDELSPGLHKGLELCRALMGQPTLLLLDEPAAGLSHGEIEQFIDQIRRARDEFGLTLVIVEHHMGVIAALTDQVTVLDHGRVLMTRTAEEVRRDPRVIEAYLGDLDGEQDAGCAHA